MKNNILTAISNALAASPPVEATGWQQKPKNPTDVDKARAWLSQGVTKPPVAPEKPSRPYFDETKFLTITPEFVAEVLRRAGVEAVSGDEREKLRELERRYLELDEQLTDNSFSAAARRFNQQVEDFPKQIAGLTGEEISKFKLRTKESFQDEAVLKKRALKFPMRAITDEATLIAKIICLRIEAAAKKVARELELSEKAAAEKFGLTWSASPVCITAWQLSWRLTYDLESSCPSSPRQILKTIPIKWE
jgi:hypothetical protein